MLLILERVRGELESRRILADGSHDLFWEAATRFRSHFDRHLDVGPHERGQVLNDLLRDTPKVPIQALRVEDYHAVEALGMRRSIWLRPTISYLRWLWFAGTMRRRRWRRCGLPFPLPQHERRLNDECCHRNDGGMFASNETKVSAGLLVKRVRRREARAVPDRPGTPEADPSRNVGWLVSR